MLHHFVALALFACGGSSEDPIESETDSDSEPVVDVVTVQTSEGSFELTLFEDESPITSANFLDYIEAGFYDGEDGDEATTFHRVISGFMVQGGGVTETGTLKSTEPSIENEAADSGISNERGTVAMARLDAADSATSQFFINVVDNDFLDPGGSTEAGYAVFAEVTSGMDIVDAIAELPTDGGDVPLTPVIIESVVYGPAR